MNITAITIENFKGIRDAARVELRPVTLLFGANSAGKSSVVQALHYAHEILERHNVDPGKTLIGGEAIELGGFETLVHMHERGRVIRIRLDLEFTDADLPTYRLPYVTSYSDVEPTPTQDIVGGWVELRVSWSDNDERPVLDGYEVGLNGTPFASIDASNPRNIRISSLNILHPAFARAMEEDDAPALLKALGIEDAEARQKLVWTDLATIAVDVIDSKYWDLPKLAVQFGLTGQIDALPTWGEVLGIQEEVFIGGADEPMKREFIETLSSFIVGPGELARNALRKLRYVGPLRQVPPRNFQATRSPDESRWASGLAAWDTLTRADEILIGKLNEWLARSERLRTGYRVEVKRYKEIDLGSPLMLALRQRRALDEDDPTFSELDAAPTRSRVVLRDESSGIEVSPQDVGVGISQLIPVLVAALSRPGIVAIEQPELHIHPAWQVVLGDLFLSQAQEAGAHFLLETHSEHLVLRIMRRMRETFLNTIPPGAPKAEPKDVAVYYVEIDENQTIIREMPLNEAGELIKAWPGGFFEEGLREQIGDAR
jgi:hypothetical protein